MFALRIFIATLIFVNLIGCAKPPASNSAQPPSLPSEGPANPAAFSSSSPAINQGEPAASALASPLPPVSEPTPTPVVREHRQVQVAGQAETWKLVWRNTPQLICADPDFNCPCIGFQYGERGTLDLVRSRPGATDDVLPLTPLFTERENPAAAEGFDEAALQRWPVLDTDHERFKVGPPIEKEIASRKSVQIMKIADYNHDGQASEFVLQIGTEPCGHSDTVLIGVTSKHPTLHVFASAEEPGEPLITERRVWEKLLTSKGKAIVTVLTCGDHGSETEIDAELRADAKGLHDASLTYECTDNFKRGKRIPADQLER